MRGPQLYRKLDIFITIVEELMLDFQSFLSKTDASQAYEFHSLTGGLVNLTSRARKTSSSGGGIFPRHDTLILKYAPPVVAAPGEDAPFSQDRQVCITASNPNHTSQDADLLSWWKLVPLPSSLPRKDHFHRWDTPAQSRFPNYFITVWTIMFSSSRI